MTYQQMRERHHQFFVSMFIATFLGATFFTAAGHFFIGTFGNGKTPELNLQYMLVPILVVAGLVSYMLPWAQLPFANNAYKFWFKNKSLQTKLTNLIPMLVLAFIPFMFGMLPIYLAIHAGSSTYLGPLFVLSLIHI